MLVCDVVGGGPVSKMHPCMAILACRFTKPIELERIRALENVRGVPFVATHIFVMLRVVVSV